MLYKQVSLHPTISSPQSRYSPNRGDTSRKRTFPPTHSQSSPVTRKGLHNETLTYRRCFSQTESDPALQIISLHDHCGDAKRIGCHLQGNRESTEHKTKCDECALDPGRSREDYGPMMNFRQWCQETWITPDNA